MRYLLPTLREKALPIAEAERLRRQAVTGVVEPARTLRDVFHTQRPSPDTKRPYGYFEGPPSEPRAPLRGQTEAQLSVYWWGDEISIEEFAEALAPLDGNRAASYGDALSVHYLRNSRVVNPEPELPGVYGLVDLYTAWYFLPSRIGASWP